MVAFLSPLLLKKQNSFVGYSTAYTTPGTDTIPIPVGATAVTVECYGAGGSVNGPFAVGKTGGGGGAYARRDVYAVAGLTAIYISVPNQTAVATGGGDCFARENTSGGSDICRAKGGGAGVNDGTASGGSASSSVGDVRFRGGQSRVTGISNSGGGGAGGPSGAGGDTNNSHSGGAGGGGVAGAGGARGAAGDPPENGANYGGGGGGGPSASGGLGAQGYLKLTWA